MTCSNGVLDDGEECDDGNRFSGDGCSSLCRRLEIGWACPTPGQACVRQFTCGDGNRTSAETCDDGNSLAGDGCSALCQTEAGYTCPTPGAACTPAAVCGDGILQTGEVCDPGSTGTGTGCQDGCATVSMAYACYTLELGLGVRTSGSVCYPVTCAQAPRREANSSVALVYGMQVDASLFAPDCAGVCGGYAFFDECGVCSAGTTGLVPNAAKDSCGVCYGANAAVDACDVCWGTGADLDACRVCHGGNLTCTDCNKVPNGPHRIDSCGACTLPGSASNACLGCNNVTILLGGQLVDMCGVCGGSHTTSCPFGCDGRLDSSAAVDCTGVCGGPAFLDGCKTCINVTDRKSVV